MEAGALMELSYVRALGVGTSYMQTGASVALAHEPCKVA